MSPSSPRLSIIVPVLNEAAALPPFFAMLGEQQGVTLELVISDGGSEDGTLALADEFSRTAPFPCIVVRGGRGRGRQLNAGVAAATGDLLLFLHVDSRFADPLAVAAGIAALAEHAGRVAGRFALRFDHADSSPSFAYYFYESKARLDRPGCIHGDQGFLISRDFFRAAGPFSEDLDFLEDEDIAAAVRRHGEWCLLPAEIWTSARRFEAEGLPRRQTLNAMIMALHAVGRRDLLRQLPGLYRQQARAGRLQLLPFFRAVREHLGRMPWREREIFWYRIGGYVRANAWQVPLAWRAFRSFRHGRPPGSAAADSRLDRWFDLLTDHPPGRLAAAALVRCWFHANLLALPGPG